jgi:hypothetical protein
MNRRLQNKGFFRVEFSVLERVGAAEGGGSDISLVLILTGTKKNSSLGISLYQANKLL